jgi:Lysine methyltransferase
MKTEEFCCYQDLWREYERNQRQPQRQHIVDSNTDDDVVEHDVSDIFFQLANAPLVSFRLSSRVRDINDNCNSDRGGNTKGEVVIEQDVKGAAQKHTGGIVWETAYLLLEYLIHQIQLLSKRGVGDNCIEQRSNVFSFLQKELSLGIMNDDAAVASESRPCTIVELGAGCGMLGLTIHKTLEMTLDTHNTIKTGILPWRVILTETAEVMHNLERNYHRNFRASNQTSSASSSPSQSVSICELDWINYREHCQEAGIAAHSVDLVVGTDVVFSTRFVEPLLRTMEYLCHDMTVMILCLQERCPDSHALLLDKSSDYGFVIEDISEQVFEECDSCKFGKELDCKLLQFTTSASKTNSKKKRKDKKEENPRRIVSRGKKAKLRGVGHGNG